jgi:hypothetical protein
MKKPPGGADGFMNELLGLRRKLYAHDTPCCACRQGGGEIVRLAGNTNYGKRLTFAWNIFAGVVLIVGLVGLPDDVKKWGAIWRIAVPMVDHDTVRNMLVVCGLTMLAMSHAFSVRKRVGGWIEQFKYRRLPVTDEPPMEDPMTVDEAVKRLWTPRHTKDLILIRQMIREGKIKDVCADSAVPGLQCPHCRGNGLLWGKYEACCKLCHGTGEVPGELVQFPKCLICKGTGRAFAKYKQFCRVCHGWGVRIPDI